MKRLFAAVFAMACVVGNLNSWLCTWTSFWHSWLCARICWPLADARIAKPNSGSAAATCAGACHQRAAEPDRAPANGWRSIPVK